METGVIELTCSSSVSGVPTRINIGTDCQIDIVVSADGMFMGLGRVSINGVPVRSDAIPLSIRLDTPDGILYSRLELSGVEETAEGANIHLIAHGLHWGRGEYGDDYAQSLFWLRDNVSPICDKLTLTVRPLALTLAGREWLGFSYFATFHSDTRRIHRLLMHGTWEIGGAITGNTVLSQGQCNMPVYHGSREELFTTACLKTLDQHGKSDGYSFQFGPRGGLVQGFDLQYAKQGALLMFWPDLDSVSSLIESPVDSDLLHVVDEYRFSLSMAPRTPEKYVLFTSGSFEGNAGHDLWWDVREHVYGLSRAKFNISPTLPVPELNFKYRTRVADGRLKMRVGAVDVDSAEVPYAIAEHILPVLAAQGIRRFFPEVMSESDVTVLGMRCKLDDGVHGELHCASVCATHRFFPSEFWGGIKAWKHMADAAHSLGMEIGAWFAPHVSPRSPIFSDHPEYRMIDANGLPAGGGYGFSSIVTADWNTPIADWVLDDLRRWREEGGLDYLFTDSLSNLGLVQANYSQSFRTNFAALGWLYARIQGIGIRSLSCECISPWMYGRFGMADLHGGNLAQDRAVAGQNDFGWWLNNEEMMAGVWLNVDPRNRSIEELGQASFRAAASGGYLNFHNDYDLDHLLPEWRARVNHLLNQARPYMGRRRVLRSRAGVAWEQGSSVLIWTFRDYTLTRDGITDIRVLDGVSTHDLPKDAHVLPAWNVYLIEGRKSD